jgi:hypothetical protein
MTTWTEQDLATLKTAIASGVLTVAYDGPPRRTITYQNLQAMRDLLAEMKAELGEAAGTRTSVRFATSKKGF